MAFGLGDQWDLIQQLGIQEAESLISLGRETVGIKERLAGIFMDIRDILMHLDAEARFLAEIEAKMRAYLRCFREAAMPKISNLSHPYYGLSLVGSFLIPIFIGPIPWPFQSWPPRSYIRRVTGCS